MSRSSSIITPVILLLMFSFTICAQERIPDEWITYFEKSNYLETPRYKETMDYFRKFEANSPYAKLITFGVSPQGRELKCLIVTKGQEFTSEEARKSNKAIILVESGIHSGEIEGKDASMLLLREILITKGKENLLDNLILLVIPILNVDGHERVSAYNRINQNGPKEMGWRTTAQNLNLNRDFMKADAPEMQALLKLFSDWMPDFFIDSHTTDGADYQYTVTYGIEKFRNIYEGTAGFLQKNFIPFVQHEIEKKGFLMAPYVGFKDEDVKSGLIDWAALPRFSTGYAALQNRPSLLIETHMLKPYKDRVFSTKETIEASLQYFNSNSIALKSLNREADESSIKIFGESGKHLPVEFTNPFSNPQKFLFKGVEYIEDSSWIAGKKIIKYIGKKYSFEVPFYKSSQVTDSVTIPYAYLVPRQWSLLADRMKLHGIRVEELQNDTAIWVERYRFSNVKFSDRPYEGRSQPSFGINSFTEKVNVSKGTFIVYTNQRTIRLIANLLEPNAPDSFVKWGFLNSIFEKKEYFEDYSMEPLARQMAKANPKLKEEFLKKLNEDESFRKSPEKRLNFFYEHSEYYDKELNLYPVMRIKKNPN